MDGTEPITVIGLDNFGVIMGWLGIIVVVLVVCGVVFLIRGRR